jgi:23S rRNA (uracil1939-C5)-methyltransferase
MSYPAQLAAKTRRVQMLLPGDSVLPCVPSPRLSGYRNRGKYVVAAREDEILLGAYAPRGQELVDMLGCKTVEPAVGAMAHCVHRILSEHKTIWPFARYVVIRGNQKGQTLVVLVTNGACPRDIVLDVATAVGRAGTGSVLWVRNDETSGTILTANEEVLYGAGTLEEELVGIKVAIGAGEFLQVNRDQADWLYRRVAELLVERSVTRAVDLYCGAGGFALAMAQRGITVTGMERDPSAVELAQRAASAASLSQATFVVVPAEEAALPADIPAVVIDPPRKGLTPAALSALLSAAPKHLIYVSCQPKSFARDAAKLINAGYQLLDIQPVDMMPGTGQVELLSVFERRKN